MRGYDLSAYDGVLAFGEALARRLSGLGLGRPGLRLARSGGHQPVPPAGRADAAGRAGLDRQLGRRRAHRRNWKSSCCAPARDAGLPLDIHGVRYPDEARAMLGRYGARYRGWVANASRARGVRAASRDGARAAPVLRQQLPGIPTIRVFEALACGIPLVSGAVGRQRAPVHARQDYLVAADGAAMTAQLTALQNDPALRAASRAWSGDDPGAPHLRPPSRRTARHRRYLDGRARAGDGVVKIAFYGSSLLSSYWNGAATYYRGMLSELAKRGHAITFYEPDAFDRQAQRDIEPPDYAKRRGLPTRRRRPAPGHGRGRFGRRGGQGQRRRRVRRRTPDRAWPRPARRDALYLFWDVDAAATLARRCGSGRTIRCDRFCPSSIWC